MIHLLAPLGTNVVYGQPTEVVLRITTLESKNNAEHFFQIRGERLTLVSIAVCVRDGVDWIDGCMESLVVQTHSPIEIILVGDGSSDGGRDAVEKWSKHELVTTISQDKLGLSTGHMAALEKSRRMVCNYRHRCAS